MRATCDLNALFQRFGRAARGIDENGLALLFVDKKDTDEYRNKQIERKKKHLDGKQKGKRKATTHQLNGRPTKRNALIACNPTGSTHPTNVNPADEFDGTEDDDEGVSSGEDSGMMGRVCENTENVHELAQRSGGDKAVEQEGAYTLDLGERRVHYAKRETHTKQSANSGKTKGRSVGLNSPMDDFINATQRGLTCLRTIPNVFFDNDQRCKCGFDWPRQLCGSN